jgi:hypothetical protein
MGISSARAQQSVFVCTSTGQCQTVAVPAGVPDYLPLVTGTTMTACPRGLPIVEAPVPGGGEVVACGGGLTGTTLLAASIGEASFGAGADFCSLSAGGSASTTTVSAGITDC